MRREKIRFENQSGIGLSAIIDLPDARARAYVLFAHCFTCTKNLTVVRRISKELTDAGFGVMSFDFTGLGESDGEFSESTFTSQSDDLVAAAEHIEKTYGQGPRILVGHSLGGTAALYAAREIESIEGVVTIGSPVDPAHVTRLFEHDIKEIDRTGVAQVSIGGRPFAIKKKFVDDLRDNPPKSWLHEMKKQILIFHSPADMVVDIQNAQSIYQSVPHPKSFFSLNRADHLVSKPRDARNIARVLAAWAESFIEPEESIDERFGDESGSIPPFADPIPGYTVSASIGSTPYATALSNGRHTQLADEPQRVGGEDVGGNPYDYLLWSLAACTVMTVKMYADRKKWPVESIRANLTYEQLPAAALGFSDEESAVSKGRGSLISVVLEVQGDLDADQRTRLLEIAHRCPVHRTLVGPKKIEVAYG